MVFEGIDTIAEVYLNGEKLADCNNMHMTYRIPVEGMLQPTGNTLTVVIRSSELWAREHQRDMYAMPHARNSYYDSQTHLRKARYQWGWDNAPRLLTNGIWRPVYLEALPPCRFDQVYLYTRNITDDQVSLGFSWSYITPAKFLGDHALRYTLYCDGQPVALMGVRKAVDDILEINMANDTLKPQTVDYKITAYAADGSQRLVSAGAHTTRQLHRPGMQPYQSRCA